MEAKDALEMFEEYRSYWSSIYKEAKDDLQFYIGGNQWSEADREARAGRPVIEVNVLPQYVHQVTNQVRQNTPHINIMPADSETSEYQAEIVKGLIRKIEYQSNADEVYDTASEYQVKSSFGWIFVDHDYISPESPKQHLTINRIQNPLACFLDPNSIESDGSDAMGAIILDEIDRKTFEKKYKGKAFVSFEKDATADSERETITIAEVFIKEYADLPADQIPEGYTGERTLQTCVIRRYKFSGADTLEETTFPADFIPLIPVYGQELWIENERHLTSLIRNAKDPQRRYNYWASVETEILSKAPKAPFMAASGSIENHAEDWEDPESSPVLRYDTHDIEGSQMPMPTRVAPISAPIGIINAMQGALEDIKRSMGLYDASVGNKSNETSGIAIQARQDQGNIATFHFPDNLARSITQVGRVLVSAIPKVYDTEQMLQIIDKEEKPKFVGVNGAQGSEGQKEPVDLTIGKFDVRVTTGANYITKTQEENDKLSMVISKQPQLIDLFGDIWAEGLDTPNAERLAERFKRSMPPQLTDEQEQDPEKMKMQEQMQQMQEQIQGMGQALESKEREAEMDRQEKSSDAQLKMRELDIKQQELELKKAEAAQNADMGNFDKQIKLKELALEEQKLAQEAAIQSSELMIKQLGVVPNAVENTA